MIRLTLTVGALALVSAASSNAAEYRPLPRGLASLSPDHFVERVVVVDDPLDDEITLSTERGYKKGQPMRGVFADDVHLRARISRSNGKVTWQVSHTLINFGARANVTQVVYSDGQRNVTVAPTKVDRWQDVCSPGDTAGPCFEYMRVVFDVPQPVVDLIASGYRPGSREPWKLRFRDDAGTDMAGGLAPAEAAGLLLAVREWASKADRANHQ